MVLAELVGEDVVLRFEQDRSEDDHGLQSGHGPHGAHVPRTNMAILYC